MKPFNVKSGTDIITQGDSGDLFYVMSSGRANVLVDGNQVGAKARTKKNRPRPRAAHTTTATT